MSAIPHHRHGFAEPQTASNDPVNGMLDLFEAQVRLLLDNGAEAAVRARLARLLPEPSPAASAPCAAVGADDALLAASGASVLRQLAKLRRAGPARSQIEVIAGFLARLAQQPKPAEATQ